MGPYRMACSGSDLSDGCFYFFKCSLRKIYKIYWNTAIRNFFAASLTTGKSIAISWACVGRFMACKTSSGLYTAPSNINLELKVKKLKKFNLYYIFDC